MKHIYQTLLSLLLIAIFGTVVMAQSTEGGTTITNVATGSFIPTGGSTAQTTESNTVTTEVNTIYSFNVEPDGDGATDNPVGTAAGDSDYTGTPSSSTVETVTHSNDQDVPLGTTDVTFVYELTNNTNADIDVNLAVNQNTNAADDDDTIDLQNIRIYVWEDTGDGVVDTAELTLVTGPISLTQDGTTADVGELADTVNIVVIADIPATAQGGDTAEIDLVATNTSAVGDGVSKGTNEDANVIFENNNVAEVTIIENAQIGLAKNLDSATQLADGTYDLVFTFLVENLGNVDLAGVQISEDLRTELDPALVTVNSAVEETVPTDATHPNGLTADAATYTVPAAGTSMNLLDGSDTLAVGESKSITVKVNVSLVTPVSFPLTIDNTASASANSTSPTGTGTTDVSTEGTDPDTDDTDDTTDGSTDGDGDPNEEETTEFTLSEDPQIGIAKEVDPTSGVVDRGDGSYEVAFNIRVENLGTIDLENVQVTDDLRAAFGPAAVINILGDPTSETGSGFVGLTTNASFDGDTDQNLLAATGNTLAPGEIALISFTVHVTPDTSTAPYLNSAKGTGTSPNGTSVTDYSDNGTEPDADGDGLGDEQNTPVDNNSDGDTTDAGESSATSTDDGSTGDGTTGNENDPTPIPIGTTSTIGVAKIVDNNGDGTADTDAIDNGDGTYTVTYVVTIENLGSTVLNNVQATDTISGTGGTFPAGVTIVSVSDPTNTGTTGHTPLTINAAFDGNAAGDVNLLAGTDSLAQGEIASVQFSVTFNPNDETGPFNNTAFVEGTDPSNNVVTDDSNNSTDPDPDGNGSPTEGGPTPVSFEDVPSLGVAKQLISSLSTGTTDEYEAVYDIRIQNIGNVELTNLQITEDFATVFGGMFTSGSIVGIQTSPTKTTPPDSSQITLNSSFNGDTDTNLLDAANSSLEPNDFAVIRVSAIVNITGSYGPYLNQVKATGESPDGERVVDFSDEGTDVDTDGDGLANEQSTPVVNDFDENGTTDAAGETVTDDSTVGDGTTGDENDPTPVSFIPASDLEMVKEQALSNDSDCSTLVDPGYTSTEVLSVDPGQFICYRIVATNNGGGAITEVNINDVMNVDVRAAGGGVVVNSISITGGDVDGTTPDLTCSKDSFATAGITCPAGTTGDPTITDIHVEDAVLNSGDAITLEFAVEIK